MTFTYTFTTTSTCTTTTTRFFIPETGVFPISYEAGRLVRQGRDTRGLGHADVLSHLDASGKIVQQEIVSGSGRAPDKKLYLNARGQVAAQCVDAEGDGTLEMKLVFEGQVLREALIDTNGDGRADQREVYAEGQRVRLEADTNGDGRPDVVQFFEGDEVVRQDEDSDFDGTIDLRFEDGQPTEVGVDASAPAPLGELGCGPFHAFWQR